MNYSRIPNSPNSQRRTLNFQNLKTIIPSEKNNDSCKKRKTCNNESKDQFDTLDDMLLQYPSQSEHKHITRSVYHVMTSQLPLKKRSLHAEGPKNHNCYIKSKSQTRADQQQKSQPRITTT